MGYLYQGRRLCCGACLGVGSADNPVRKRTCPHKVTASSVTGRRQVLAWCSPPALCNRCTARHGGNAALHAACAADIAVTQRRYDAEQARIDAGELMVTSAAGTWHPGVDPGWVRLTCRGLHTAEQHFMVRDGEYTNRGGFIADYPSAISEHHSALMAETFTALLSGTHERRQS